MHERKEMVKGGVEVDTGLRGRCADDGVWAGRGGSGEVGGVKATEGVELMAEPSPEDARLATATPYLTATATAVPTGAPGGT